MVQKWHKLSLFNMKKTYLPKKIERQWHLIDAKNKVLGRLASQIAFLLCGKHKSIYTPHIDVGDWVVVINAKDIKVTGKKLEQKKYWRYTGYPGGIKKKVLKELMGQNPTKVIIHAVSGMLPKNRLRRGRLKRLKIFLNAEHPYKDKFKI